MPQLDWQSVLSRDGHKVHLSGHPIVMHCHHYNINLQKTLEETLGDEGITLLFQSAEEAGFHSLQILLENYSRLKTVKSILEMAAILYQNCGLGIIHFQEVGPHGGRVTSSTNHHVTGWLAKHGRRDTPGCHFIRGWIAGILESLFGNPLGYYDVKEVECKMMRDPECVFKITENAP